MQDFDICNVALSRIGQRQFMTSLNDGSLGAQLCTLLYPLARDALLTARQWRFASRQHTLLLPDNFLPGKPAAWLVGHTYAINQTVSYNGGIFTSRQNANTGHVPVAQGSGSDADFFWEPGYGPNWIPGWQYTYLLPSDFLAGQYIFSGLRPGMPLMPSLSWLDAFGVSYASMMPVISGSAPQVPFFVQGNTLLFCDFSDAQLVYTVATTDPVADSWPQLFCDALAWRLAIDLALADAKKPALAEALEAKSEKALSAAVAAEGNNQQPDIRPDASVIAIRG